MSTIKGHTLFFTTSPRTPIKMLPEIELLACEFTNKPWNTKTQTEYAEILLHEDFYQGSSEMKDPALAARDRINRAPKALGFVDLKPVVRLTDAGHEFLEARHKNEAILRQLLKFQLPSPFHKMPSNKNLDFWVKPYLEMLRLIRHFGTLTFDEMQLFGMQLTNYNKFDCIVEKINQFRVNKALYSGNYRKYFAECAEGEIKEIYAEEFKRGDLHVRESKDRSSSKFINTKKNNLRDYTDACFRYLRATELVEISQSGHSLSIAADKLNEADYLLAELSRDPVYVEDQDLYKQYLFDSSLPKLYTDDAENLKRVIKSLDADVKCEKMSLKELKNLEYDLLDKKKQDSLTTQIDEIKKYKNFNDIIDVFERLEDRDSYYDRPLIFEWNTWRAMTMLDGGQVHANLSFDDEGEPLSTAPGNIADVVCDYGRFQLSVEVTLQVGQKQYDNEGEPIARHVGKIKKETGQPTYCFFIAPKISPATIAYFYTLYSTNIDLYGGITQVVPLELKTFEKMVCDSKKASYVPTSDNIKKFIDAIYNLAIAANDEIDWYEKTKRTALNWLKI